ncbi:transporter, NhaC family [Anaerobranca californiensis DSM 14826]|uniref:Transporter, NhaC family n=1 Tax=Anaerobranca californiensis DSM 14826 TaxID=1120989 RepID=A0A1M6RI56_9FIRM|nr:Na+/H+ antiporter NhaC family protein [Anaerobranca californiensis]SHK32086.1 transporter, NhaC family [Anaerobranca californiensis DSM 14826]
MPEILTLLPPLVAILLAFVTKNVLFSLFIGVLTGTFLLNFNSHGFILSFFYAFIDLVDKLLSSLADPWNAGVILQCLAIGGLIAVVSKMGGAKAIAESLSKRAKSAKSTQLITWLLGLFVFFDDYANSLIVGPIMRPVADKMKISREKLAFIIDATAAPIAGMAIISTWIGYEISLIRDGYAQIGETVNAYGIFIETIPYRFYNIFIMVLIILTAILAREFGPMLTAEKRAKTFGKVIADDAKPLVSNENQSTLAKEGIKLSIWNAIIPIGSLILLAFLGFYYSGYTAIMSGEDLELIQLIKNQPLTLNSIREIFGESDASVVLFQSAFLASIIAIVMAVSQKIMTLGEAIDTWLEGVKSLIITGAILLLAWSLSATIKELGTAPYLAGVLSETLPGFLLPSLIFILGAVISFATGTSYGTMGILMPLVIPLAYSMASDVNLMTMSIGAVLTGAIFGDHCSPISDTTILSSMGSMCDHLHHVKTQLYYAISIGIVTVIFGYLPVALGVPVTFTLLSGILACFLLVRFIGKPVH